MVILVDGEQVFGVEWHPSRSRHAGVASSAQGAIRGRYSPVPEKQEVGNHGKL